MATKQKPGKFDCYGNAEIDEPIFTLKASDPTAPSLIRQWASDYVNRKIAERQFGLRANEKVDEALKCARDMEIWRAKNPR